MFREIIIIVLAVFAGLGWRSLLVESGALAPASLQAPEVECIIKK